MFYFQIGASKMKKFAITFFLFLVFCFVLPKGVFAANLWLSPVSGSYAKGSTLKVNIGVDTKGEKVNAVQANLTYPSDKLQFTSVSTGGSALTIIAEKTGGGGYVKLGGGTPTPGIVGSKYLGAAYFKVLVDSGSGSISFAGDSAVVRDSDNANVLSAKSTATFSFSASLPGTQDSNGEPTTSEEGVEELSISDVSVNDITTNSAIATWKTSKKATSTAEYGLNADYKDRIRP